jgi:hypothetical protein
MTDQSEPKTEQKAFFRDSHFVREKEYLADMYEVLKAQEQRKQEQEQGN